MSIVVNYKGVEIASANTDITKTLKTSGKYCKGDIEIVNTQDGGTPVINPLSVTENGTYTASGGVDGYSPVTVNVPQGITPSGNINITDTNVTDVTQFATAQVVDADLVAENIKEGVNILGILGTFAGGGGLPSKITAINAGIVTWAQNYTSDNTKTTCAKIAHGLASTPNFAMCYALDGYPLDAACRIASWTNNGGIKNAVMGEYQQSNGVLNSTGANWNTIRIDSTNLNIGAYESYPIKAGTRMIWIAAVLDYT